MDAFAIFGVERRPLLDAATLKQRYFELAARAHPDSAGGDAETFRNLQDAYRTLDDPVARLRALGALVWPGEAAVAVHPDASLFMEVGAALQAAGTAWKKASSGGALSRALGKGDLLQAGAGLQQTAEKVRLAQQDWENRLAELDARWPDVSAAETAKLAASGRFLARWQAELAETEFLLKNG